MRPKRSTLNGINMAQRNTIFKTNNFWTAGIRTDAYNIRFSKPCSSMSDTNSKPSLAYTVLNVVVLRAKEKMRRINTSSVIALMKNLHIWRDRSAIKLIGVSMGTSGSLTSFPDTNNTISVRTNRCRPQPTRFSLVNLFPKSFFEEFSHV